MSSLRHKITYLTTGLARAGAEMQLLLLCEKFVKAGWEVSVISLLPPEAFVTELKQLGIPLVSLELRKHLPDPRAFLRLVRTLRNWSPDVLHCHQVHANLLGRLARAFTNIPVVVCTAHSINEGPRWREWAYRLTDPLCDLTTNVCQAGVDRYVRIRAVPANKICYLPNGVDLDRFVHAAERRAAVRTSLGLKDEFVWLAVGNLRKPKDYPTMLEAFRQVRIGKPHARLVIVGGGPLNEALQLEVKEKGIGGVCFLGPREDVPDIMCAADGFLMSSSWEGTPLALLEANGLSLPVVATRVGGIAEVVVDTESGLLVRSGDPAALACACLRVMNASPEQRAELGRAGRNRVEALFSIDVVMKRWQQVYTQLWQRAQKHSLERGTGVTILHVLGDSSYGGAAKIIVRLAQLGCSEGWKARILTSDPGFQKAAYDAGIDYTDLDCIWREIRPLKDIVGLYRLWRFLKSERVTIVHTHTTKAGFIGRIAARLAGVPIIIHTVHGFAFHEQSSWGKITFYTVFEKLAACCCHRIITVSKFHRKWALDLRIAGAEKLQAIPNGIPDILETEGATRQEIRASLGVFDDDVMLFTPGRLAPEKGLEDLIAAVGATRGCLSRRLQVLLAGNGPLRPVLEQNARALGLTDEVRFLGFRTDIGMLLKAADIVALPSDCQEGCGSSFHRDSKV